MSSGALLLQCTTEIVIAKENEGPRTATGIGTEMDDILAATEILPAAGVATLVDGGWIGVQHQQLLPETGRWPRGWDYDIFFSGDCIFSFSSGLASRFPYQKLGSNCVIYPVRALLRGIVAVADA